MALPSNPTLSPQFKILYIMQTYAPLYYEQDDQHFRFVYFSGFAYHVASVENYTGFRDFIMGSNASKVEDAYDECAKLNEPLRASLQSFQQLQQQINELGYSPQHCLTYDFVEGMYMPKWLPHAPEKLKAIIAL